MVAIENLRAAGMHDLAEEVERPMASIAKVMIATGAITRKTEANATVKCVNCAARSRN